MSLFATIVKRRDRDRLAYYIEWAGKASMHTKDVLQFAAYSWGQLDDLLKRQEFLEKVKDI